eukprot:1181525-Prorocentrum_minimum.AAC.3
MILSPSLQGTGVVGIVAEPPPPRDVHTAGASRARTAGPSRVAPVAAPAAGSPAAAPAGGQLARRPLGGTPLGGVALRRGGREGARAAHHTPTCELVSRLASSILAY